VTPSTWNSRLSIRIRSIDDDQKERPGMDMPSRSAASRSAHRESDDVCVLEAQVRENMRMSSRARLGVPCRILGSRWRDPGS